MRLYIWEGNRISHGYHDDGTLVVLAETVEQARQIAIASAPLKDDDFYRGDDKWDLLQRTDIWQDGYGEQYNAGTPHVNKAIEREPDRVVELDAPAVVAFNGGGYD